MAIKIYQPFSTVKGYSASFVVWEEPVNTEETVESSKLKGRRNRFLGSKRRKLIN
jgi:hypothetical protein